ncbi:Essential MCU regulator [Blattella germanica]|nr:Essential MCU regulator [Blattella germanica]
MATKLQGILRNAKICTFPVKEIKNIRYATTSSSGAILPEPRKTPFGLIGLVFAVVPGLLIGANISKKIANFLEENDLFVPSDDDDDDD